jgi:hypothetical protein
MDVVEEIVKSFPELAPAVIEEPEPAPGDGVTAGLEHAKIGERAQSSPGSC